MTSLLAIGLFIAVILLLYLLVLSSYGVAMRRVRRREHRHDRMKHATRGFSEARDVHAPAEWNGADADRPMTPDHRARKR